MIIASSIPWTPMTFQSVMKISPISPAIAPRTMPKLSPIPAMIGIRSDNTRNESRATRATISWTRYSVENRESGIATMLSSTKMIGTAYCTRKWEICSLREYFIGTSPSRRA